MRCISPLLIRSDGRRDVVPCGKCNFCLQAKRVDWSFRLFQEMKVSSSAYFLTLTYEDDKLPWSPGHFATLCKEDHQMFIKRLRKAQAEHSSVRLRYYAVGEYGTRTGRPHYHDIMFNMVPDVVKNIQAIWQKGNIMVGSVTPASIHYVTKYVINRVGDFGDRAPPFAHMSRRPGLGVNYLATHKHWHKVGSRNFTQVNGKVSRLPRFYKDRIFSDLERRRMALEVLDESDRAYWAEIARLSSLNPDPCSYYDERDRFCHDAVTSKVNSLNHF